MSYCGVSIYSESLSGLTAEVTFIPCSGGTINLGNQVFPFTYANDYYFGTYNCYVPLYDYVYTLTVPCPSATPTPTNTETPTPTPTNTETPTPTPTETPSPSVNYYYSTNPVCISSDYFENVVLDSDFCNATTITSSTILSDGTYIIGNGSERRPIIALGGVYTFDGDCAACA